MTPSETAHTKVETTASGTKNVGVCTVKIEKIGEREAQILAHELALAGESHGWRLAIDLSQVTFLPSVGLGMLVKIQQTAKKASGGIALFGVRQDIANLLKITHLDKVFKMAKDRAAAISAVS